METSLVSNPPYNLKWTPPGLAGFMHQYMEYQVPPKSNANYAFILSGLSMIDGKAIYLLPNGCLSAKTKEEKIIIHQLIENNLLAAVIALPDSMFESTSIPVCMMIFDKHKSSRRIEMIDMKSCFCIEVRDQNGQFGGLSQGHRKRSR